MLSLALPLMLAQSMSQPGYEERLVAWALEAKGRERELAPEGKRVEEILIAEENIFAPSDPWPGWLNVFHAKTHEDVVAREVLLAPGDMWTKELVEETERNLRRQFILAVAKVVAVKGREGGVGLLVVTKDRWSLRLNSDFTLIGSLLQYLRLQPTEMNFLGRNQEVALDFILRLDALSVGQTFIEPRLFGTKLALSETAAAVFNRSTGALEGSYGSASFGEPLITLDQPWAFNTAVAWNVRPRRIFRGASVWLLPYPDDSGPPTVPYRYNVRELGAEVSLTRNFGTRLKADVTVAAGAYSHRYTPIDSLPQDQRSWFLNGFVPRTEDATYTSVFFRTYTPTYQVLRDIAAFQLSEDYQVGPVFKAGARWALPAPLSTAGFVQVGASLRYRLYAHDDLLTFSVAATSRLRGSSPANERLAVELVNYSPPFEGGRFVARFLIDLRRNDLDHTQVLLGGSTGLRGLLPDALSGSQLALANFEYRLRAFEVATTWVGLVGFYDVGSAFDGRPNFVHSVGVGVRILLPQFNQEVIRIDFGVVIGGDVPGLDRLNASYGQVTDIRPAFLDQPL